MFKVGERVVLKQGVIELYYSDLLKYDESYTIKQMIGDLYLILEEYPNWIYCNEDFIYDVTYYRQEKINKIKEKIC